jgi:endo-1,4-beta-xylanase
MNKITGIIALGMMCCLHAEARCNMTMKDVIGKYFLIGVAINTDVATGKDAQGAQVVKENFNSIVAENCMKGEVIHPEENRYDWDGADKTVKFALDNHLVITGHCLIWHSQPPKWMFTYANGDTVSRSVLINRMYHHITDVVTRYRGKVKGWDVVNEAFCDDGSYRQTPYYKIIGPEYIELAFKFAHAADPDAELYYNDYSVSKPQKRDAICHLIRELKAKGYRIDGSGMQSHNGADYPDLKDYETAIDSIAACGVKVLITEMDINMLPNPASFGGADIKQNYKYDKIYDPYANGITEEGQKKFEERYLAFFDIFSRHRSQIGRVTLWGIDDSNTWLNDFPIPGRTNYPLLFARGYKPKPVIKKIIDLFK